MEDIIDRVKSYRQELISYEKEVKEEVQRSLLLIDSALGKLEVLDQDICPFCSAVTFSERVMQTLTNELNDIFDLPDTFMGGGFIGILNWVVNQDEDTRCGEQTEWFCKKCRTGKLVNTPHRKKFRFHWDRENLPKSRRAIATRIFGHIPLVSEIALLYGSTIHTWYILYDGNWYISLADNDVFEERWGLAPRDPKNNSPTPGSVYLLRCENWYKIGRTTGRAEDRVAQIDVGLPFETTLIYTISVGDCVAAERDFHNKFSEKRQKGEWFKLDDSDIDYIRAWRQE